MRSKIDFSSAMLDNAGGTNIPNDYAEFLEKTNGMIAVPFEFYGTEIQKRNECMPAYNFPNIVDVNQPFFKDNKNLLMKKRIVVGQTLCDLIIFDGNDKKYKLLQRINFKTICEFNKFDDVIEYVKNSL